MCIRDRYYITVSYDPENWPEGFAFSQSNLKITAYRNGQWGGSSGEQQITRYVTVSSTEVTCGANLAYPYALKVEINDARYTGSITTGILTVQKSPLNVKVRDIYATTGETINLGFDLIDDGITSFGLQGDDFLNSYAVITYTVTNQQGEDVTGQLQSLEPGEYTVRMSMPAGNERLIQSDYEYNGGTGITTIGQYALNFLPGKLVITEEPYVNPTACLLYTSRCV